LFYHVDENFLPLTESFLATPFEQIEAMFHNEARSTFAYAYMAQPMALDVPPFCLNITGTNNRFDAKTVLSRWKHMLSECKLHKIHVISFSGDGDTRLLTSMRLSTLTIVMPFLSSLGIHFQKYQ